MTFPAMADASLNRIMQPIAPFATAIAAFSYTLYLTHRPTNNILATIWPNRVNNITLETLSVYGLRVAICVLVATALYFCFERKPKPFEEFSRPDKRQFSLLAFWHWIVPRGNEVHCPRSLV
jgi:peptidoglycan/LPS O-acetylase OafA/YrhL